MNEDHPPYDKFIATDGDFVVTPAPSAPADVLALALRIVGAASSSLSQLDAARGMVAALDDEEALSKIDLALTKREMAALDG